MITKINLVRFLEVAQNYKYAYELKEISLFESIYLFTNSFAEVKYQQARGRVA